MEAFRQVSCVLAFFGGSLTLPGVAQGGRDSLAAAFAVIANGRQSTCRVSRKHGPGSTTASHGSRTSTWNGDGKPDVLVGGYPRHSTNAPALATTPTNLFLLLHPWHPRPVNAYDCARWHDLT